MDDVSDSTSGKPINLRKSAGGADGGLSSESAYSDLTQGFSDAATRSTPVPPFDPSAGAQSSPGGWPWAQQPAEAQTPPVWGQQTQMEQISSAVPVPVQSTTGPGRDRGQDRRSWMLVGGAAAAVCVVGAALLFSAGGSSTPQPGPQTVAAPATVTVTQAATQAAAGDSAAGEGQTSGTDETSTTSTESSTDSPTSSGPTDEAAAVSDLDSLASSDLSSTNLDGSWAAQISSQFVGVTDTTIQPGPFSAVDIYNLHERLRVDSRFAGSPVVLLKQNDFGQIVPNSRDIWITLVLINASSSDDVDQWCSSHFAETGTALLNVCVPRQMVPPHS